MSIGLYRDDGLSCFENKFEPELEKIKKKICKIYKDNGSNIAIETNFHSTEYLEATLNLKAEKYYPYRKRNNSLQHIHKQSNHPPSIIKQILSIISKRLFDISSDKEHFDKAAPIYNEALENGGFNETLKFLRSIPTRRHRGRIIIWFNLKFSRHVKANVGKLFLALLQKHFSRHHKYYKLLHKNNVKICYSCMPNMKSVIQNDNANLLSKQTTPVAVRSGSCRKISECPLNNKCLSEISQTLLQINKYYYGTCEKTFKERYNNHPVTFMNTSKQKSTELSKLICELKGNSIQYQISWDIASRDRPYDGCTRKCDLCLTEKLMIAKADASPLLNTRDGSSLNVDT